jgi:hypothetical protein
MMMKMKSTGRKVSYSNAALITTVISEDERLFLIERLKALNNHPLVKNNLTPRTTKIANKNRNPIPKPQTSQVPKAIFKEIQE